MKQNTNKYPYFSCLEVHLNMQELLRMVAYDKENACLQSSSLMEKAYQYIYFMREIFYDVRGRP